MTSPAAIWLMSVSESCLMAMDYFRGFAGGREEVSKRFIQALWAGSSNLGDG